MTAASSDARLKRHGRPRHAKPRKPLIALPGNGIPSIVALAAAAGLAATMMGSAGQASSMAGDIGASMVSARTPPSFSQVSRSSIRKALEDTPSASRNVDGASTSAPVSSINEARSSLNGTLKAAQKLYDDSAGKVADENTRTTLKTSMDDARTMMSRSTLKSEIKGLADRETAVKSAEDAVNASMQAKSKADADQAKAAAAAAMAAGAITSGNTANPGSGGYGRPVKSAPSGEIQQYAHEAMKRFGWGDDQWDSLNFIITNESGWNQNAMNSSSGAKGLFQCLGHKDCDTDTYMSDYKEQIDWGLRYIANRYGTPNAAADYWRAHGSY